MAGNSSRTHSLPRLETTTGERTVRCANAAVHERVDCNAAARRELAVHFKVLWPQKLPDVVVDHVHNILMEVAVVAESGWPVFGQSVVNSGQVNVTQ